MSKTRHPGRIVGVLVALGFVLMALSATLFPTYRAPDEPEHVDLAIRMSRTWDYPAYDEMSLSEQTDVSLDRVHFMERNLSPDDIAPRGQRGSFADLAPDVPSDRPNRMPQHPPLYYAVLGSLLRIVNAFGGAALPYDMTVWILRIFTAVMVAPLPALAYATVRRLGGTERAGFAAAAFPLMVPQLIHIGSSVNNDGLLILLAAVLTLFVAKVLRGDDSHRTAIAIGVVLGLALLTKGFALVFPIWVVLLYFVVGKRSGEPEIAVTRLAEAALAAFVAGGWWWVRNLIVLGRLQSSLPAHASEATGAPQPIWWAERFIVWFVESFWGWLGWLEVKLPIPLIAVATLVLAVTLAIGLIHPPAGNPITRGEHWILLTPGAIILGIVINRAYSAYVNTGVTAGIQGRYLFPMIAAIAAIAATLWVTLAGSRSRAVPAVVLLAAAIMLEAAFVGIVSTYYGPADPMSTWLYWAPVPSAVPITLFVLIALLYVVALFGVSRGDPRSKATTQPRVMLGNEADG